MMRSRGVRAHAARRFRSAVEDRPSRSPPDRAGLVSARDDRTWTRTRDPHTRSSTTGVHPMRVPRSLVAASWLLALCSAVVPAEEATPRAPAAASTAKSAAEAPGGPFLVKPYLQLGHASAQGALQLLWH